MNEKVSPSECVDVQIVPDCPVAGNPANALLDNLLVAPRSDISRQQDGVVMQMDFDAVTPQAVDCGLHHFQNSMFRINAEVTVGRLVR